MAEVSDINITVDEVDSSKSIPSLDPSDIDNQGNASSTNKGVIDDESNSSSNRNPKICFMCRNTITSTNMPTDMDTLSTYVTKMSVRKKVENETGCSLPSWKNVHNGVCTTCYHYVNEIDILEHRLSLLRGVLAANVHASISRMSSNINNFKTKHTENVNKTSENELNHCSNLTDVASSNNDEVNDRSIEDANRVEKSSDFVENSGHSDVNNSTNSKNPLHCNIKLMYECSPIPSPQVSPIPLTSKAETNLTETDHLTSKNISVPTVQNSCYASISTPVRSSYTHYSSPLSSPTHVAVRKSPRLYPLSPLHSYTPVYPSTSHVVPSGSSYLPIYPQDSPCNLSVSSSNPASPLDDISVSISDSKKSTPIKENYPSYIANHMSLSSKHTEQNFKNISLDDERSDRIKNRKKSNDDINTSFNEDILDSSIANSILSSNVCPISLSLISPSLSIVPSTPILSPSEISAHDYTSGSFSAPIECTNEDNIDVSTISSVTISNDNLNHIPNDVVSTHCISESVNNLPSVQSSRHVENVISSIDFVNESPNLNIRTTIENYSSVHISDASSSVHSLYTYNTLPTNKSKRNSASSLTYTYSASSAGNICTSSLSDTSANIAEDLSNETRRSDSAISEFTVDVIHEGTIVSDRVSQPKDLTGNNSSTSAIETVKKSLLPQEQENQLELTINYTCSDKTSEDDSSIPVSSEHFSHTLHKSINTSDKQGGNTNERNFKSSRDRIQPLVPNTDQYFSYKNSLSQQQNNFDYSERTNSPEKVTEQEFSRNIDQKSMFMDRKTIKCNYLDRRRVIDRKKTPYLRRNVRKSIFDSPLETKRVTRSIAKQLKSCDSKVESLADNMSDKNSFSERVLESSTELDPTNNSNEIQIKDSCNILPINNETIGSPPIEISSSKKELSLTDNEDTVQTSTGNFPEISSQFVSNTNKSSCLLSRTSNELSLLGSTVNEPGNLLSSFKTDVHNQSTVKSGPNVNSNISSVVTNISLGSNFDYTSVDITSSKSTEQHSKFSVSTQSNPNGSYIPTNGTSDSLQRPDDNVSYNLSNKNQSVQSSKQNKYEDLSSSNSLYAVKEASSSASESHLTYDSCNLMSNSQCFQNNFNVPSQKKTSDANKNIVKGNIPLANEFISNDSQNVMSVSASQFNNFKCHSNESSYVQPNSVTHNQFIDNNQSNHKYSSYNFQQNFYNQMPVAPSNVSYGPNNKQINVKYAKSISEGISRNTQPYNTEIIENYSNAMPQNIGTQTCIVQTPPDVCAQNSLAYNNNFPNNASTSQTSDYSQLHYRGPPTNHHKTAGSIPVNNTEDFSRYKVMNQYNNMSVISKQDHFNNPRNQTNSMNQIETTYNRSDRIEPVNLQNISDSQSSLLVTSSKMKPNNLSVPEGHRKVHVQNAISDSNSVCANSVAERMPSNNIIEKHVKNANSSNNVLSDCNRQMLKVNSGTMNNDTASRRNSSTNENHSNLRLSRQNVYQPSQNQINQTLPLQPHNSLVNIGAHSSKLYQNDIHYEGVQGYTSLSGTENCVSNYVRCGNVQPNDILGSTVHGNYQAAGSIARQCSVRENALPNNLPPALGMTHNPNSLHPVSNVNMQQSVMHNINQGDQVHFNTSMRMHQTNRSSTTAHNLSVNSHCLPRENPERHHGTKSVEMAHYTSNIVHPTNVHEQLPHSSLTSATNHYDNHSRQVPLQARQRHSESSNGYTTGHGSMQPVMGSHYSTHPVNQHQTSSMNEITPHPNSQIPFMDQNHVMNEQALIYNSHNGHAYLPQPYNDMNCMPMYSEYPKNKHHSQTQTHQSDFIGPSCQIPNSHEQYGDLTNYSLMMPSHPPSELNKMCSSYNVKREGHQPIFNQQVNSQPTIDAAGNNSTKISSDKSSCSLQNKIPVQNQQKLTNGSSSSKNISVNISKSQTAHLGNHDVNNYKQTLPANNELSQTHLTYGYNSDNRLNGKAWYSDGLTQDRVYSDMGNYFSYGMPQGGSQYYDNTLDNCLQMDFTGDTNGMSSENTTMNANTSTAASVIEKENCKLTPIVVPDDTSNPTVQLNNEKSHGKSDPLVIKSNTDISESVLCNNQSIPSEGQAIISVQSNGEEGCLIKSCQNNSNIESAPGSNISSMYKTEADIDIEKCDCPDEHVAEKLDTDQVEETSEISQEIDETSTTMSSPTSNDNESCSGKDPVIVAENLDQYEPEGSVHTTIASPSSIQENLILSTTPSPLPTCSTFTRPSTPPEQMRNVQEATEYHKPTLLMRSFKAKKHAKLQICRQCDQVFSTRLCLVRHIERRHKPNTLQLSCNTCHKKFASDKALSKHVQQHKSHTCKICDRNFLQRITWKKHLEDHVREGLKCTVCSKEFAAVTALISHLNTHTRKKTVHVCDICNKTYANGRNLRVHKLTHTGDRPHSCPNCNRSFAVRSNMLAHKDICQGKCKFRCDSCDRGFPLESLYKRHLAEHEGKYPHVCGVCNKGFFKLFGLKAHEEIHSKSLCKITCKICKKELSSKMRFKLHMKSHSKKPVSCPICKKTLARASQLEDHIARHNDQANHHCPKCNKAFFYKANIRSHVRRAHLKEKPFTCSICAKKFSSKHNLQMHMNIHTRERPFQCDNCGKAFSAKSNYKRHLKCHLTVQKDPDEPSN